MTREILRISLPSMGSSLVHSLYSLVDMMWIGKLGKEAVASVTLAMSVLGLTYILNEIFGVSSMVLLTRRWGEGRKKEFEKIVNQVLMYKIVAGTVVMVITFSSLNTILSWFGSNVPLEGARTYYLWRGSFLPFSFALGTMMTTYRSIGDTRTLFVIDVIGSISNVFLDPVLMFWLDMGVSGSALASGICETLTMFLGFHVASKKWEIRAFKFSKPDIDRLKKVISIGTPSLFDSMNWSVWNFFAVRIFSSMGVLATAAYGITSRVSEVVWMMGFALEGAITTLVGQNLGKGAKERARRVFKTGLRLGLIMGAILSFSVFAFAGLISDFFTDEPDLVEAEKGVLRVFSPTYTAMLILNVAYGTLIGGGRTIDTFFLGLLGLWGFNAPLLTVFTRMFPSLKSAVLSLTIGYSSMAIVSLTFVSKSRKWLDTEV